MRKRINYILETKTIVSPQVRTPQGPSLASIYESLTHEVERGQTSADRRFAVMCLLVLP